MGASLMHSGRVPAKISTRRGFAVDPIPGGPIGSVRSRTTPSGDECNSSRIADARKRTAEVIFLAERTEPLISMRPALRQGQVRIILPTAAAANVTNLFRTRHTYCSSDLLLSDRGLVARQFILGRLRQTLGAQGGWRSE